MRGEEGHLIGGLSLLSGYINQVRREEKNVLYCIAGDMVQGSLIDAKYKGISTMEIMNYLAPDVATLGDHKFDYGLPHLLFLEKMANFPHRQRKPLHHPVQQASVQTVRREKRRRLRHPV
jgi:5'-nucleotidase